jgi:hypothetical protein
LGVQFSTKSKLGCRRWFLLNRLEIIDDCLNVLRAEHEDRHIRVARDDSFGERLG